MISPIQLAFILSIAGALLHKFGHRRKARVFYITAICWLLVFSQPYISDLLIYPLEHGALSAEPYVQDKSADFILPLACFYQTNGKSPSISRWSECSLKRQLMADHLARQYGATLLLTGGNFLKDENVNYSQEAASLHRTFGFSESQLHIIGQGSSTREELQSITQIVGKNNIIIVTSATHAYRVAALSAELGMHADVVSVNFHSSGELSPYIAMPSIHSLEKTRHALYEYFAILKYKFEAQ
ncbi:YdcF family protein [Alteromonas sediminis]|nr:YdcF family protein [Alteromonas sediminis]